MFRLFVAVPLPEDVLDGLEALVHRLKHKVRAVKWVNPSGMHLTLKFLGNTPEDLVPRIREAARSVASGLNGASLVVAGLGAFPDAQRPRVLWVGLHGDVDVLAHAALGLSDALEPLGFPEDARPWAPHVTLARARTGVRMGPVSGIAQDFARTEFGRFTASEMVLYRSELTPRGAVYTALDRFPFLTR